MARQPDRLPGIALSLLSILTAFLTGAGLIMAAALKSDNLANYVLSLDPRYALAMDGLHILQDFKYPLPFAPGQTRDVGVLKITDPSWRVILDFTKSEIAIRKSERNQPPFPATPPAASAARTPPPLPLGVIPRSSFDRAKTIIAIRLDVAMAGDQALAPPYRLILISPISMPPGHRAFGVYEFLSFEEFRLDLRDMILNEMEEWSLWLAVIAFACGLPIETLRRIISAAKRERLLRELTSPATADTASAPTDH